MLLLGSLQHLEILLNRMFFHKCVQRARSSGKGFHGAGRAARCSPWYPELHVQSASDALLSGEEECAGQIKHDLDLTAPRTVEYVPAPQLVHPTDPVVRLYLPGSHVTHSLPPRPE